MLKSIKQALTCNLPASYTLRQSLIARMFPQMEFSFSLTTEKEHGIEVLNALGCFRYQRSVNRGQIFNLFIRPKEAFSVELCAYGIDNTFKLVEGKATFENDILTDISNVIQRFTYLSKNEHKELL